MSTEPGSDPIGDFQRWLMKAGARSLGRDVAGRVRATMGGGAKRADVWETATTEDPTEPPECQWCPVCRAARRYRESGGMGAPSGATLGGQLAGVSDTLAGLTRDAFSLFDAAMKSATRPPAGQRPTAERPSAERPSAGTSAGPWAAGQDPWSAAQEQEQEQEQAQGQAQGQAPGGPPADGQDHASHQDSDHGAVIVGSGIGWPTAVHPQHEDDEPAHEGGDRQEGGEPGDGRAGGGGDEQVERPAE
jgi:hypothetical protein